MFTQDVPYWIPVSRTAIIDDSADTVKILNFGDPDMPHVEIPTDILLAYTNCNRIDWACSLLEMAVAAGALSMLLFTNDYWKGGSRAIPIVDTQVHFIVFIVVSGSSLTQTPQALLAALPTPTGSDVECQIPVDIDGTPKQLQIVVAGTPTSVQTGVAPALDDFVLAGLVTDLQSAYAVAFNLIGEESVTPSVWRGFLVNGVPNRSAVPAGLKRKRFSTMME